ncbi:MAG: DUF3786 domain-containing protein [Firmicutes bacterium]|nr:DUF3786 domain-containing protein [Bacillota bacterium]
MNKTPYNLGETLLVARRKFSGAAAESMAANSGSRFIREESSFVVPLLGQNYLVSYPEGLVTRQGTGEEAPLATAILLLHYLSWSTGVPLSGSWISYKELQGGAVYIDPFSNRAVLPFVKNFGGRPREFARAAQLLGGEKTSHGHLSYRIPSLPRVPLLYILWEGDEEFPPSGTILFDRHANEYLHTEDYAVLAGMTAGALVKILR